MNTEQNYVVKISTAMSNAPLYIKIADPSMSVDKIVNEAVSSLKSSGKPLEGQQLAQLYLQHQIYNNGKVVQKGNLFTELNKNTQVVNNQPISMVELDFVSSQSGGH